jgi:hypothetical protein
MWVSCSKEDLKPKRFLVKEITITDNATNLPHYKHIFEYNTQGKIASISYYQYDPIMFYKTTYEYSVGQIIKKRYDGNNNLGSIITMNLGSNGFVSDEVGVNNAGAYGSNTIYTYNSDGFLLKKVENEITGNTTSTFEIVNRNTIKENSIETTNSVINNTRNYDNLFDSNLNNPFSNLNFLVKKGYVEVDFGFYGRPNKNLLTEIAYKSGTTNINDILKYTLDENGNIEKIVHTKEQTNHIHIININYTTIN